MYSEISISRNVNPLPLVALAYSSVQTTNKWASEAKSDKKPNISWHSCDFILKQLIKSQPIFWSLQPTLALSHPFLQSTMLDINLQIELEKQFDHGQLEGWLWHKTWILPAITVKIDIKNLQNTLNFQFPPNTYVIVMAVKPSCNDPQKFYLIDVGLQGMEPQDARPQPIIFSGLKFSQTSYKHEGSKFNLMVALVYKKNTDVHPLVIDCKISPPIFVDSRRNTKDEQHKKIPRLFEIFAPDVLDKHLTKRKKQYQQVIEKDGLGFVNYFTAPNIRNKIKNPFFLAYKFSEFITLYYNSVKIQNKKDLVSICMNKFGEHEQTNGKVKFKKSQSQIDKVNPQASISLILQSQQIDKLRQPCIQAVQKNLRFQNSLINVLYNSSLLPKHFIPINNPNEIRQLYYQFFYLKSMQERKESRIQKKPTEITTQQINPQTVCNSYLQQLQYQSLLQMSQYLYPIYWP